MKTKRPWKEWPKRFNDRLLNSWTYTVGAGILGIAGLTFFHGLAHSIISLSGLGLFVISLLISAIQAIPPRLVDPSIAAGNPMHPDKFKDIFPAPIPLGFVGPSGSGKSTIKSHILQEVPPETITERVEFTIIKIKDSTPKYLALFDGAGKQFAQQFDVAQRATILFILVDHNHKADDIVVDAERIKEDVRFMEQLRDYLKMHNIKYYWIHILINKRDLWEKAPQADKEYLRAAINNEIANWEKGNWAETVTWSFHSNLLADDMVRIFRKICSKIKEFKND